MSPSTHRQVGLYLLSLFVSLDVCAKHPDLANVGPSNSTSTSSASIIASTTDQASTENCGRYNGSFESVNSRHRIYNGEEVQSCVPWQVGISRSPSKAPFCGGALIDSRHVLTAAHCVTGKGALYVRLGYRNGARQSCSPEIFIIPRNRYCIHESYDPYPTAVNDIAILRLPYPAKSQFTPLCLPVKTSTTSNTCYITGYGKRESGQIGNALFVGKVRTLPASSCWSQYMRVSKLFSGIGDHLNQKQIFCAEGEVRASPKTKVDACYGDSGGPLFCQKADESYELFGLVSWGQECALYPGVYTNVRNYLDWVTKTKNAMSVGRCR